MSGEIIRKDSLAELVGHRAVALEKYAAALEMLTEARAAAGRACVGGKQPYDTELIQRYYANSYSNDFGKDLRYLVDRAMWRSLVVNTPLFSLMDTVERKKFETSLEEEPPEVTVEALLLNIERLTGDADMIFKRGLVNAFKTLSRDYRSHDGFKIGGRVVLTYVVSSLGGSSFTFNHYSEDRLRDIDRVMHVLDGKPEPDYQKGLTAALRSSIYRREGPATVETPYFRARWFANGNAHLWFLRDDLVEKANKIIAEHYGMVVGASPDVATKEPVFDPNKEGLKEDFFATPGEVVEQMIEAAEIEFGMTVLEPSAGEGAILVPIVEDMLGAAWVFAYENNPARFLKLSERLDGMGAQGVLSLRNFLEVPTGAEHPSYDRILMNPPFSGGQALAHLFHAWDMLRPGGRLVAILPPGGGGHSSQRAKAKFTALCADPQATVTALPEGAFLSSGTAVRTVMVTLNKPDRIRP